MDISWWRDLVIVIWGIVATIAVVVVAIVMFLLYRKISTLMDSMDYVMAKTSDIIDYAEQEVLKPVIQLGTIVKGFVSGASFFANLFKRKEEKDE